MVNIEASKYEELVSSVKLFLCQVTCSDVYTTSAKHTNAITGS